MKKLITIVSLIAIVALLASLIVMPVSADTTEVVTGSCGENVTFTLYVGTGELTISGTGPMADTPDGWADYKGVIRKVIIEDGVTSIGKKAFNNCQILETIEIPASVQSIGEGAFSDCLKLYGVVLPEGLTVINKSTFSECYALSSIVIPDSVVEIKGSAFSGCGELRSVDLGSSVTTIGKAAFQSCNKLASLYIPGTVTSVGLFAFAACDRLSSTNVVFCGTAEQWDAIKANIKSDITPLFHTCEEGADTITGTTREFTCMVCGESITEILDNGGEDINPPEGGEDVTPPVTEAPTTEAPTAAPTAAPTTEAATTVAPTTAAATTEAPATEATEEGGCGAFLASGAIVVALTSVVGAAYVTKRKED